MHFFTIRTVSTLILNLILSTNKGLNVLMSSKLLLLSGLFWPAPGILPFIVRQLIVILLKLFSSLIFSRFTSRSLSLSFPMGRPIWQVSFLLTALLLLSGVMIMMTIFPKLFFLSTLLHLCMFLLPPPILLISMLKIAPILNLSTIQPIPTSHISPLHSNSPYY